MNHDYYSITLSVEDCNNILKLMALCREFKQLWNMNVKHKKWFISKIIRSQMTQEEIERLADDSDDPNTFREFLSTHFDVSIHACL